ncbi:MAG: DUF4381 domain-containing protein [Rhodanobacteraceae bacterium]
MNGPALRDIHVPAAGWWPLAPGWWLLLGVAALVCAGFVAWRVLLGRQSPLRAALREIGSLEAAYARDHDAAQLVEGVSRLMRRVALRIEPGIASQSGDAWRAFVNRHAHDAGARGVLDRLDEARFRARPSVDATTLAAALRVWCRDALRWPRRNGAKWRGETRVQYAAGKPAA